MANLPCNAQKTRTRQQARHADGHRPHRHARTPRLRRTRQPRRVGRSQRGVDRRAGHNQALGHSRTDHRGVARDVQKRNSQPPNRDRTLRRRRHLPRRLHSRSALRPLVCLSSHARHRRGQSAHAIFGNATRQIATTKNLPHRSSRVFLLRQPDRPRHR